jgi:uncharacterized protein (DUF2235 family)
MSRNIVILSDGTGNSAAKLFKTNVWRLYQALDVSKACQVAFYDDGVGASSFKLLAILGGVFGIGLKRNLIALYMFLCRNYQPGDRIYAFGFSRGAFTTRVLIRFVLMQGLVIDFDSRDDLKGKASKLFREFRRKEIRRFQPSAIVQSVCYFFLRPLEKKNIITQPVSEIQFLGVWDTIDAYGLPIEEFKLGIDRLVWPLSLVDSELSTGVTKACHALSIDDNRMTFHPLLWDEADAPRADHTDKEKLTQVWFAGSHSNVGGGYPDDGLASVSLRWMINEASSKGLRFNARVIEELNQRVAPFGRLYDPRSAFGAYYRYAPRRLDPPIDKHGAIITSPKIHESVILRIAFGTDSYAPLGFPTMFRIVADRDSSERPSDKGHRNIYDLSEYQTRLLADEDHHRNDEGGIHSNKVNASYSKIDNLQYPKSSAVDLLWATVWWRQVAYFATLGVTGCLIAYPYLNTIVYNTFAAFPLEFELATKSFPLVPSTTAMVGIVADVLVPVVTSALKVAMLLFPPFAKPLVERYLESPWAVTLLCVFVALFLAWGRLIDRRIHDRALAAWSKSWEIGRSKWLQQRMKPRIIMTVAIAIFMALLIRQCLFAYFNHDLDFFDCPRRLDRLDECLYDLQLQRMQGMAQDLPLSRAVTLAVSTLLGFVGCFAIANAILTYRVARRVGQESRELPSLVLWVAIGARKSRLMRGVRKFVTRLLVPMLFVSSVAAIGLIGFSKFSFNVMDRMGFICPPNYSKAISVAIGEMKRIEFDAGVGCNNLFFDLEADQVYEIEIYKPYISPESTFLWPLLRNSSLPRFSSIVRSSSRSEIEWNPYVPQKYATSRRRSEYVSVFVNDYVVGVPYFWDLFYRPGMTEGEATVTISNISKKEPEIPP